MDRTHLLATPLLDHDHASITALIARRGWAALPIAARIGAVYGFVRDEIAFGYNTGDRLPASRVLADRYGQCNTKTILVMALLRAVGIPCRFHGATIHKRLQRGVVTGLWYWLAPTHIVHSWAEVRIGERWVALEGVILDADYLDGLRAFLPAARGALLGYGVGTADLAAPPIDWRGEDTAIQMTGVDRDLATFASPDAFYAAHGANLTGLRAWLFRHWVRHRMNRRVGAIRGCAVGAATRPAAC